MDSNCRPQSVVIVEGVPKRKIYPLTNVLAIVAAVISTKGQGFCPACEPINTSEYI